MIEHTEETNMGQKPFGVVYLPGGEGAPVGQFRFLVEESAGDVQIGTPVTADTQEGPVVGIVVDMRTVGDQRDPVMADYTAVTGAVALQHAVMVATVQVFYSGLMRPVTPGSVRAATKDEVLKATGYERMEYRIPGGSVVTADGSYLPVYLDGKALLGPESAHLMCSGLSGQAAKTSYIGFLIAAAMSVKDESVAALIFNVKGEDSLFMDQPPAAGYELTDIDRALYEAMGVPAEPFSDFTVYSPPQPGTRTPSSVRDDAQLLSWDLNDVWGYLSYMMPNWWADSNSLLRSFLEDYRASLLISKDPNHAVYRTIDGFENGLRAYLRSLESDEEVPAALRWISNHNHHEATVRKALRQIGTLHARGRGLIARGESNGRDDLRVDAWTHGQVSVIDIARLQPDVQSLVVGRTLDRMLKQAEDGDLGVDHLIVFCDELNVFAAQGATAIPGVRKVLQRVATQGRYAGISLVGAAQKLSKIDELVRDNAATSAIGITSDSELASGVYGRLASGLAERIATLPRGQMALRHSAFRAPIVVQFPRPAWQTGRAKTRRKAPVLTDTLGLSKESLERLTEGLSSEQVDEIIAEAGDPTKAREAIEKARRPDMHKAAVWEPRADVDPDNPFVINDDDEGYM